MAYDGKNKYPKKTSAPRRQSVGRKPDDSPVKTDDNVKLILDQLKSCRDDMKSLNDERLRLYKAYKAEKYGNEIKGRSELVMTDVSNTVETVMPNLMRIFYGGQNVVEVRPQSLGDEDKARLMQEKINFDFQKGINGYKVLYNWFKDALVHKMGVVKWWWDEIERRENVEYEDLTMDQFMSLQAKEDFVITSVEEEMISQGSIDPMSGMMLPPVVSFDVKGYRVIKISKPMVENVPPEEFIFDIRMKDRDSGFIAHRRLKKKKDILKDYGSKSEEISEEIAKFDDPLYIARFEDLGGISFVTPDRKTGQYYVYECYDNNRIITIMGELVLRDEENAYGCPPFCVVSPILEPHRMIGRGIAELGEIYQALHTALARYIMDNIAFQSNGMNVVNPYRINVDDLLNGNKPGGIVRTKYDIDPNSAVFPVPITPLASQVFQFFEMTEQMRENSTGVSRLTQGLDSKSLNRTATGISQIMGAAQQRIELIARTFAETGLRDLFQDMINLNLKFFDSSTSIKINDEWMTITPEDINGNFDVLVDVGVGTGSTELKVNQMMQMLQNYGMVAQLAGPMVQQIFTLENVKNIIKEIWQAWGYKDTSKFVAPDMKGVPNGIGVPPPVAGGSIEGQGGPIPPMPPVDTGIPQFYGGVPEAAGMGLPPY